MQKFTLTDAQRERASDGELYHEFLHVPAMSVGLYELAVGAADPQEPHTEDELYYVSAGRAMLLVGAVDVPVEAGTMVYVSAGAVHRFHSVTEALSVVVIFAPAEYTNRSVDATG